jgi:hypothetical protein
MGQHAIEGQESAIGLSAFSIAVPQGDGWPTPLGKGVGALQDEPGPKAFDLDLWIATENPFRLRQS